MIIEKFAPIKGYEGLYEISNFGRVKSLPKTSYLGRGNKTIRKRAGCFLKTQINKGYLRIGLCRDGIKKRYLVHQLVWDHFGIGKRDGRKIVPDHIDDNKENNRIDNLQLLTNRQNNSKRCLRLQKTSKYTGVTWHKATQKWQAAITINKKRIHLGLYNDEHSAHLIYEEKLQAVQCC